MPRRVISGEPGESWTNNTGKILWQLKVTFHNSCGLCISFANQISTWWPVPFHRGCNCTNVAIAPGHTADPFLDFEAEIRKLDPVQRKRVMGKSLWTLVDKDVVKYEDVVTRARVRSLAEVVARQKLTVDDLTGAGLTRARAERAWQSAHTEAHDAASQEQRRMVGILRGHGLSDAQIREALATKVAGRAGLADEGPPPLPPPPKPVKPKPTPRPKPPAEPKPTGPFMPGEPIADRIKAWKQGDEYISRVIAEDKAIDEEINKLLRERMKLDPEVNRLIAIDVADLDPDSRKARSATMNSLAERIEDLETRRILLHQERADRVSRQLAIANPKDRLAVSLPDGPPQGPEQISPSDRLMYRVQQVEEWLGRMMGRSSASEMPVRTEVVQYDPNSKSKRPYYWDKYKHMVVEELEKSELIAHEAGHGVEYQIPGIQARANEFRDHRVGAEKPTNLNAKFGGYDPGEEGYEDEFHQFFGKDSRLSYYTGKKYDHGSTEIISMGLQALYSYPARFAKQDPEYFKFIVGILHGVLR